ncbi:phytanoyl-CoA dioxygenase family protein [Dokdonella sp.]|uniref:phytanoyl-CoA dioxygenase family protein n=1 Tax=Dokdonella sp. TaxID=2291710 RepID=UPI001B10CFC6|nr:phytanoyl-CoA dioxygenase family protein [Dokdonella sp.]MBO9663757.1 phytanoyl-CoA dioxygenase family protein [Dokdonella sp.]
MIDARRSFDADGYVVLAPMVSDLVCDDLLRIVEASAQLRRAGSRRLLDIAEVADVARALRDDPVLADLLPPAAVAVQCTLFSKDARSNWSVAPHQDLSVPVSARMDAVGWTGWSRKQQVWFVQPPATILETLIAVRLQLDPVDASGGPLRVVPGSHRRGRLTMEALARMASTRMAPCLVERGGTLVMKPLLVHASGRATAVSARRVLHFLYGPAQLPDGLRWANAIH